MSGYDLKEVADFIGLDVDTVRELLDEFFIIVDRDMSNLREAIDEGNDEMITHIAHKLKGACGNMLVEPMRECMEKLQDIDKSEKDEIVRLFELSETSYQELKKLFDK